MRLCDFTRILSNCTDTIQALLPEIDYSSEMTKFALGIFGFGLLNWLLCYIFVGCLNYAAAQQVFRIRQLFLRSVLRQDVGWYDTHQTGDFPARMTG